MTVRSWEINVNAAPSESAAVLDAAGRAETFCRARAVHDISTDPLIGPIDSTRPTCPSQGPS
jgi:hypothetical protein